MFNCRCAPEALFAHRQFIFANRCAFWHCFAHQPAIFANRCANNLLFAHRYLPPGLRASGPYVRGCPCRLDRQSACGHGVSSGTPLRGYPSHALRRGPLPLTRPRVATPSSTPCPSGFVRRLHHALALRAQSRCRGRPSWFHQSVSASLNGIRKGFEAASRAMEVASPWPGRTSTSPGRVMTFSSRLFIRTS